jgi:ectoine hydroxylase-related dioxygenase (phytanoyl-CoA dioxygenase family)
MIATTNELSRQWQMEGYVLVRGLFDAAESARLLEISDHARREWSECDASVGRSVDNDAAASMRHLNHPAYFRDHREMLVTLLDACADPRLLDVARAVFADEPEFYCTTYWFNPRGKSRNGNWHRDPQFVTKTEEEEKVMLFEKPLDMGLQLQLALVASDDTEVVPGSHLRWDTPEEYRIRRANDFKNAESDDMPGALRVALQPGDAVAFNASALHRGRYHVDKRRRTLMFTYLRARGAPIDTYFSRQPWVLEPDYLSGVRRDTLAFFERFIARHRQLWT